MRTAAARRFSTAAQARGPPLIALTGGPCGGKSSVLAHLRAVVERHGFRGYCSPEFPTLLFTGGARYPGSDAGEELVEFESHVVRGVVGMEDAFVGVARSTRQPSIVLCDRGALDIMAYCPPSARASILQRAGWTQERLLVRRRCGRRSLAAASPSTARPSQARYSLVIHLVTTADGAEEHYTLTNNAARTEPPAVARRLDELVQQAWEAHPRRHVVPNGPGGFAEKQRVCVDILEAWLSDYARGERA